MIGMYLLLAFLIGGIAFGLDMGWDYCGRTISDIGDLGLILFSGIFSAMVSLVVWLLICVSVENFTDFVDESSDDDEKVAALLKLTELKGIEILFRGTSPKIYCEVMHNGEIVAPMAKRRETTKVYNKLLADKKNKANLESENKLNAIIKSHLGK